MGSVCFILPYSLSFVNLSWLENRFVHLCYSGIESFNSKIRKKIPGQIQDVGLLFSLL